MKTRKATAHHCWIGNCREAIEFYTGFWGCEFALTSYAEDPLESHADIKANSEMKSKNDLPITNEMAREP